MSKIIVSILRKKEKEENQYWQRFEYSGDLHIPITTLLERLNQQEHIVDLEGEEAEPIHYSCSCQQGLCGSCAFVVNDLPGLGCQIFCHNNINKKNEIVIKPLSKFPVIRDLEVDRAEMFEVMKNMKLWLNTPASVNKKKVPFEYEVSQCLMCGCCLEACPNYKRGELFTGASVAVAAAKFIEQDVDKKHLKSMKKEYNKRFYKGCVKAFACQQVCPMELPIQTAISKMNKISVWSIWSILFSNR